MKFYRAVSYFDGQKRQKNNYANFPRKPRDTEPELHKIADEWFYEKFGIYARSRTIFCTPSKKEASRYLCNGGKLIEIEIPKDEPFKVIFSLKVNDLFTETRYLAEPFAKADLETLLESFNYQISDNLNAVPSYFSGEIMLSLNEFNAREV